MKPGTIIKLKSGRTVKAIPNIVQIINREDSCEGCCFSDPRKGCATGEEGEALACGSVFTEPTDEQVIYVEVPTDAENSDGSLVVDRNGVRPIPEPDQTP